MSINEKLHSYLDNLFSNIPETKTGMDLKEELFANSLERYQDLVEDGVDTEEAFRKVTSSIGDIDELLAQIVLEEKGERTPEQKLEIRKRTALIKAAATSLYILAALIMFVMEALFSKGEVGFVVAVIIALIPTALLIYNSTLYPKYKTKEETVVEEFKEWSGKEKRSKSLKGSVSSILWTLVLIFYFAVSFATMAWHVTWIAFLVGACLQAAINLLFVIKEW